MRGCEKGESRSVEADTSRLGSWGIKETKGRKGRSLMLPQRQWSRNYFQLTPTAAAGLPPPHTSRPRDAFSSAVPGWAETAALAVVVGAGAALRGAECRGAEKAFPEKAAGCRGASRPLLRPPTPGLPVCLAPRLSF